VSPLLRWPLLFKPLSIFLALVVAVLALSSFDYAWTDWRPATCMPAACFCENLRPGTIRQPINTWSNFSFVLVGLLILALADQDFKRDRAGGRPPNLIRSHRSYPRVYGLAVIAIGFGSLFYHASLTFVGQWLDVASMYLLGTFMVLYNLARLRPIGRRAFVGRYLLFNGVLGFSLVQWPELRRYLFFGLMVVALVIEAIIHRRLRPRIKTAWIFAALLSMSLAWIIWVLDLNGGLCVPQSLLQGHAVWHGLTALAAGLLYLYYRSEDQPVTEY
jgi:Ceramidase